MSAPTTSAKKFSFAHLIAVLLLLWLPANAQAEKRVALVIGNAAYQHGAHLATALNDASDMTAALKGLGFSVTLAADLDGAEFAETLAAFSEQLVGADAALLYFAGHSLQFRGTNYFLPTDAQLRNAFSLRREAFPIHDFIEQMESLARVSLVFLDASRKNPIADQFRRSISANKATGEANKLVGRGLALMPPLYGETLLVYSAAVGTEARDGTGRNSPFAGALLKHITAPGVEIEVMLKRVSGTVQSSTNGHQTPQRLSRLTSEFYFARPQDAAPQNSQRSDDELRKLRARMAALKQRLVQRRKQLPIPELVALPGGLFLMGCVSGRQCKPDEKPVHAVKLSPFLIAKYETTFEQWDSCVEDGGCRHRPGDEGWGRGLRPAVNVSWHDAQAYADWLTAKTGRKWRLPTEAEWEYAARAGTVTPFASGNGLAKEHANFGFHLKQTSPVGQHQPNKFGLYDMHGNVWEWVSDYYDKSYYANSPAENPKGPSEGTAKVFRGGSWLYDAEDLRSANRNGYAPEFRSKNVGFRLVREP